MVEIRGRENEVDAVHSFVGQVPGTAGPAALVLVGAAGIGKSTLWLAGLEYARERRLQVLASRPAEAERGLAYAGLSDLFEGVLDEVLDALPAPRRRAFEVALLLEEPSGDRVDHRALAAAVRGALEALGERGPVLVAVDDVQWLDAASSRALAFALRRIGAADIRLLLARRLDGGRPAPSALEQAIEADRVRQLPVGPLSVGAIHRFLRDRLGRSFPRQTLLRIHERSGGNPFFAFEVARVLGAVVDPLQPLPIPDSLDDLVRARIVGLPPATRDALALASALGAASLSVLERAGVDATVLDPALAAHVVEWEGGAIRFTHPLLSSVLYADLGDERRRVHERIAAVVEDPLLCARHLALSQADPDAGVAGVVEAAAQAAVRRGASAVAAELAEHALRLTPPTDGAERQRRTLAAARAHRSAGEWTHARTLVTGLLAAREVGPLRAEALVLLAELESVDGSIELLEQALAEARCRPALQSAIHSRLAWATRFRDGFIRGLEHARAALVLADELDDDALRAAGLLALAALGVNVGDGDAPSHASRAHELATALGDEALLKESSFAVAGVLMMRGSSDAAREAFEEQYRIWHERDEPVSAWALWSLSWVELHTGRWELAASYATRARDISVQYGLESPQDYLPIAWVAAHRGQLAFARAQSEEALELAQEQLGLQPPLHLALLGVVALWEGDAALAERWFAQAERQAATLGWSESVNRQWTADHVEALLELGRIDDAVRILGVWEADATRLGRGWVLAHVARSAGLVAAARGDVEQALAEIERAVALHEGAGDPFGEARARLAFGIVSRRARRKPPGARVDRGRARRIRVPGRDDLGRQGAPRARTHRRTDARGQPHRSGAPRRSARCRRTDEPRGRQCPLPRGADGGEPPDAHLREARRPVSHRARAPVALNDRATGAAKSRRSDVSASVAPP